MPDKRVPEPSTSEDTASEDTTPDNRAARTLNKDTQLCISLAARPSNIGTRFHNYLYDELGLNYVYKAFAPTDLAGAVARHPGARHPRLPRCRCRTRRPSSRSSTSWRIRRRRSSR